MEALRRQIPDDLRHLRDLDYATALSDQITLSTFHGCPAGEIEGIVRFLLTEMGVHVTVKLNPTLLGREAVDGLLHDVLGYEEIADAAGGLRQGPAVGQALEITDRLSELARSAGPALPGEVLQHPGGAEPPALLPRHGGRAVPLRASRCTSSR